MTDIIRKHPLFSNLHETTYGGMDPDYEVGAIEREHDARSSLWQRELASEQKWEELIGKLGGTVTSHQKPNPKQMAITSSEKPYISAKIPGGFKLTTSTYGVYLVTPEQFGKDVRKKLAEIFKSHGCDLYSSDFGCFGEFDSYYGSNAVNVGYYSEIAEGSQDVAGAIIAAVDYLGSIFGKKNVAEAATIKVKEAGWYVVDHMDKPIAGPFSEGGAKDEADDRNDAHEEMNGPGEIDAFDVLYFSDYDIKRLRESELGDMINQDVADNGETDEDDMTKQFEGKSFKRNDDDEDNLKKKQRDDERRQSPSKRDEVDEGKTYRRSDDDSDDKKSKDQERKDGAKNKRALEVSEGRPPKPQDPEDNPSMHDLKSKIMDLKGRLDKTSPFNSSYSELRNKIDALSAKLDKVKPYGNAKSEVAEAIDSGINESLKRLAELAGLKK